MAGFDEPPTQIGGPPACTGRGRMPASVDVPGRRRRPSGTRRRTPPARRRSPRRAAGRARSKSTPEQLELALHVAGADAEDRPTARQLVEGEERLGRHQRVAVRQHVDVAHSWVRSVIAGQVAERRDRVPPRRAHRLVAGCRGWRRGRTRRRRRSRCGRRPGRCRQLGRRRRRPPTPRRRSCSATAPAAACRRPAARPGGSTSRSDRVSDWGGGCHRRWAAPQAGPLACRRMRTSACSSRHGCHGRACRRRRGRRAGNRCSLR